MKNGNPMMWSQCGCDMNAWNRWPEAPRVARTSLPKKRAPADVEDLANGRLQRCDPEGAALSLRLLGGQHQDSEPHATDVLDAGKIQDHPVLPLGAASHMWREGGLEVFRSRVVDSTHGG